MKLLRVLGSLTGVHSRLQSLIVVHVNSERDFGDVFQVFSRGNGPLHVDLHLLDTSHQLALYTFEAVIHRVDYVSVSDPLEGALRFNLTVCLIKLYPIP